MNVQCKCTLKTLSQSMHILPSFQILRVIVKISLRAISWMDGCVRVCVDGWVGGWMDGSIDRSIDR